MSDNEKQPSGGRGLSPRDEGWEQPSWEGEEDDRHGASAKGRRDSRDFADEDMRPSEGSRRRDDDTGSREYEDTKREDEHRREHNGPGRRDYDGPSRRGGDYDRDYEEPRSGSRRSSRDGDGPMSLLVRHLKFTTSSARVRKYFEQCGDVKDVYLPVEYETGRPRGFGFVEYYSGRDAQEAFRVLNDTELDGARISITIAQHGRGRRRFRDGPYDRYDRRSPGRYRGKYEDQPRRERREDLRRGGDDFRKDDYREDFRRGDDHRREDYRRDDYRRGRDSGYRDGYRDD